MKWFKHYCDAHEGETINKIYGQMGHSGIGLFWLLLEAIAGKWDGNEHGTVVMPLVILKQKMKLGKNFLPKLNLLLDNAGLSVRYLEDIIEVTYPKLAKIRDNHTKNNRQASKLLTGNLPLYKEHTKNNTKNNTKSNIKSKKKSKREIPPSSENIENKLSADRCVNLDLAFLPEDLSTWVGAMSGSISTRWLECFTRRTLLAEIEKAHSWWLAQPPDKRWRVVSLGLNRWLKKVEPDNFEGPFKKMFERDQEQSDSEAEKFVSSIAGEST